jgi:hypothetical protein
MVGNDLTSFVSTWPLSSWKETLALLFTVRVFATHFSYSVGANP